MKGLQASEVSKWLLHMGFNPDTPVSELDIKMLCRANYVPIWEFMLSRVRNEREVELIRANLAVNGVECIAGKASVGRIETLQEKKELQKQRDTMESQLKKKHEDLRIVEMENQRLLEELQAAQSELNELSAVGRALSVRQVVVDAANTVVGKNVALCAEYTRRVELASAQLTEQEGTGLVEAAQQEASDLSNARAFQGQLADLKTPSAANVVEEALSEMQTAHVKMWLENEAMKARGDFSTLPSDVLVLPKMLAALYEEIDLLGVERDEKERLQVLLSEKKEQFDFLQASLAKAQGQLLDLVAGSEVACGEISQEAQDTLGVIRRSVRDVDREIAELFEQTKGILEREVTANRNKSPLFDIQGAKNVFCAHPRGRIHWSDDAALESLIKMSVDRDSLLTSAGGGGSIVGPSTEAIVATLDDAKQKHAARSKEALATLTRACEYFETVLSTKTNADRAFSDWKTLPGQFCIVNNAKRERYQRRVNHLRVLTHEMTTTKKTK